MRIAAFRSLWLALLASNIGTWMQTVGAQWLLVEQSGSDTLVAVVQTASTLPLVLLSLPSGALADTFDRRRLMLGVQAFLVAVGALLTVLTLAQRMPPTLLLTLTFVLGAGQALVGPAWQAVIPELVPRSQLASASALGAISMNLARAVGPAVAGVLIARTGAGVVFALNTVSFVIFALVLWRWKRPEADSATAPERFTAAVRSGSRYVRHSPVVQRILLRAALFLVPEPHLEVAPDNQDGPVLVTASYPVSPERAEEFVAAMEAVRRTRLQTGAVRWGLFRDGEHPDRFVEAYLVPSWDEHLRQHTGRLTGADRLAEERARALADGPPQVSHLLSAR